MSFDFIGSGCRRVQELIHLSSDAIYEPIVFVDLHLRGIFLLTWLDDPGLKKPVLICS